MKGPVGMPIPQVSSDTASRFWQRVAKSDGCWLWNGALMNSGYGRFRKRLAHRFSYAIANGGTPGGLCVMHTCDTPRCVRPDHLVLGSNIDNLADMTRKGRRRWADSNRPFASHCQRGHARTPDNVNGDGACKTCIKIRRQARYAPNPRSRSHVRREPWEADVIALVPPSRALLELIMAPERVDILCASLGLYGEPRLPLRVIAKKYGCSQQNISKRRLKAIKSLGIPRPTRQKGA